MLPQVLQYRAFCRDFRGKQEPAAAVFLKTADAVFENRTSSFKRKFLHAAAQGLLIARAVLEQVGGRVRRCASGRQGLRDVGIFRGFLGGTAPGLRGPAFAALRRLGGDPRTNSWPTNIGPC